MKRNVGDRVSAAAVRKYNLHSQVAELLSATDVRNHIRSLLFSHTLVLYRPRVLLHFFPFEQIPSIFWWFVFIHTLGHRIVSLHIARFVALLILRLLMFCFWGMLCSNSMLFQLSCVCVFDKRSLFLSITDFVFVL